MSDYLRERAARAAEDAISKAAFDEAERTGQSDDLKIDLVSVAVDAVLSAIEPLIREDERRKVLEEAEAAIRALQEQPK